MIYEGAGHGFSVRIDRTDQKQTEQAAQAGEKAVKWFTRYFGRSFGLEVVRFPDMDHACVQLMSF